MSDMTNDSLSDRYFRRLKLDASTLDAEPTLAKLAIITEAHLSEITFDNLAQHGVHGGTACLDVDRTAQKILDRPRGGYCFELNALLCEFLMEMGYDVKRVLAYVFVPEINSYRPFPSHMFLLVTAESDGLMWFVDVSFGEPAIHPLQYLLDEPQETPEGMVSRLVRDGDDFIALQWLKGGDWCNRIRWKSDAPSSNLSLHDFQPNLDFVQQEASIFSQKLIVCKVTRTEKITVAGNRLKITTPRFGPDSKQTIEDVESLDELREVLETRFGILKECTEGLDLTKSLEAAPGVWSAM
jgi:N-hydroxyarylamine O-acetyltransferase